MLYCAKILGVGLRVPLRPMYDEGVMNALVARKILADGLVRDVLDVDLCLEELLDVGLERAQVA